MAKPKPWSPSTLDDFVNCPFSFYRKKVLKDIPSSGADYLDYGNRVHKDFEVYVAEGKALPEDLVEHKPYLNRLRDAEGTFFVEQECAFDTNGQPCGYWDNRVWSRMKIDYKNVNEEHAKLVDYKTGKPHSKPRQLEIYTLHTFALHPTVQTVQASFYWTKTATSTGNVVYTRDQIEQLWDNLIPDLKQWAEAFKTDTWQKRQSGLCKAHCDVIDCQFNGKNK